MPYWITETVAALPAVLWMFVGVGLPWALVVLPRKDWRDRPMVACVALAIGPALVTAWMFLLGTIGAGQNALLLRFDVIFLGTLALAVTGAWLARRQARADASERSMGIALKIPLTIDEKLLITLIVVAVIVRWFTTSFWSFTAYDPLWVYGYEGRLYTLVGNIPQKIGYYPQFISLQYTYAQLAVSAISDHAARAVVPFLNVGSILAVYVLGNRLFNRRVGIVAAALWALYPHVGEWWQVGDLEIPQTFLLAGTAAFFLMAWFGQEPRRRYAFIAGLFFGAALWTKPTAGAYLWGILLLLLIEWWRVKRDWWAWLPRFEIATITGLASLPLGGVWYIRNVLLGHPAIELPDPFWLTQAQRSGNEFGWLILALLVLLGYLFLGQHRERPGWRGVLVGLTLVLLGLVPSILSPHRMGFWEWLALAAGNSALIFTLRQYARRCGMDEARQIAEKLGGMLALGLPYFVTWFYSYSYHYRLAFAIVPLLLMPTAVILARWFTPERMGRPRRALFLAAITAVSVPGIVIAFHTYSSGWDWLWTDKLPTDDAKYAAENPALMFVVHGLQDYINTYDTSPVVVAPGAQLLPFFFPTADIRIAGTPTRLDDLKGATHYVYSKHAFWQYQAAQIDPTDNQIVSALGRPEIMQFITGHDDGNFFYELYEPHPDNRFKSPKELGIVYTPEDRVFFGDFARYAGANLSFNRFVNNERITMEIAFEVLAPPPKDYTLFVQLRDESGNVAASWDSFVDIDAHGDYYSTKVWQPGEVIIDRRVLSMANQNPRPPAGNNYRLWFGMYDLQTGERVPVTLNGKPAGDGVMFPPEFEVRGSAQG
jgi:hypothetical protein